MVLLLLGFFIVLVIIFLVILPLTCVYDLYSLDKCKVQQPKKPTIPCGQGTIQNNICVCKDGWTGKWCQINKNVEIDPCPSDTYKVQFERGGSFSCLSKLNSCPCPNTQCIPEQNQSITDFVLKGVDYCMNNGFDGDYTDNNGAKISITNNELIYDGQNMGKIHYPLRTDTKEQCEVLKKHIGC